jgi:hypothetical protein
MWKYNGKVIRAGRSWKTTEGITHPTNWNNWSDAEKVANGLVWEDDVIDTSDSRFYWSANNPKSLDDVNEVDDNGDAILDDDGNQVVTQGLKSQYKAETKAMAGSLLAPTDWYVIRKSEDSTATIPTDVTTYRSSVRTASGTIETAIDNAADLDAFIALFDTPMDDQDPPQPTGKASINDFPDEI